MPKGREKGYKSSQEEIEKARQTRLANKQKKLEMKSIEKPILKISRKWQTGFDFWPSMRNVLRPLHRYAQCHEIEREIVAKDIWANRVEIVKILEKYFVIELKNLKNKVIIE